MFSDSSSEEEFFDAKSSDDENENLKEEKDFEDAKIPINLESEEAEKDLVLSIEDKANLNDKAKSSKKDINENKFEVPRPPPRRKKKTAFSSTTESDDLATSEGNTDLYALRCQFIN